MPNFDQASQFPADISDSINEADLEQALKIAPKGAFALAGAALALLMAAWLIVYFLVFLPRGPVS